MKAQDKNANIYMVVRDPSIAEGFKIEVLPYRKLHWKHPLVRKSGAIFADEAYAKQFLDFVTKNKKKLDQDLRNEILKQVTRKD